MRKRGNIVVLAALLLLANIATAQVAPYSQKIISDNSEWFFPGKIAVKVDAKFADQRNTPTLDRSSAPWQVALAKLNFSKVEPLFALAFSQNPPNPKNSALRTQMQNAGLGQWFVLTLPFGTDLGRAWQLVANLPGVIVAEPMPRYKIYDWPNDPFVTQQWHYRNNGQNGGIAGADIGVETAWNLTTGHPDVLVAITDGGIDTAHPDLKQNLWSGVGFNFVKPNQALDPDGHATHVAGVVAATRYNGIGISGIAGGNGTAASGIRYMSLQIVGGGFGEPGAEAEAFVYATNKGVAISQNSWGYAAPNVFPEYTKDAIDFFIANGGGSVMQGGIAIFASGNGSTNQTYFPAAYEKVMAVAASNNRDAIASYSNYGDWIDITAPGGDFAQGLQGGVYSTESAANYGYRQGTSMAAPHVSGVAALLLSLAPNRLLPDDLRFLLQATSDNIDNRNLAFLKGNMGAGRLNAGKAVQSAETVGNLPWLQPVSTIEGRLSPDCRSVDLTWKKGENNLAVVVAISDNRRFGFPVGQSFAAGDTIAGGGIVLLNADATAVRIPLGVDGSTMNFRIWTYDGSNHNYSVGENFSFQVPYTVVNAGAIPSNSSIQLSWERQCPNRPVLLAYNTGTNFGKPTGNPNSITQIAGGGTALQFGEQTDFTHSNLQQDQVYFYAFYPYTERNGIFYYADPQILASGTLCGEAALPIRESFGEGAIPPPGWRLTDGGPQGALTPDGRTWRAVTGWSADGDGATAVLPAYVENGNNSKEVLRSPAFTKKNEQDTLLLSFRYAYRAYSATEALADSLAIAVSTDCGATRTMVWNEGGTSLSTVPGTQTAEFLPEPKDWKTISIDLGPHVGVGDNGSVLFIGTNKFGQNIWLDDIRIFSKQANKKDLELTTEAQAAYGCNGMLPVKVLLKNTGDLTIDTARVNLQYSTNNQTVTFSNLQLGAGSDTSFVLVLNASPGSYPVTFALADKDDNSANDTSRMVAEFAGKAILPYTEGFELIPSSSIALGWVRVNDTQNAWRISNQAAGGGSNSLAFEGSNPAAGSISAVLPLTTLPADIDSLVLEFYTAATNNSNSLSLHINSSCGSSIAGTENILPSPNDPPDNGGIFTPAPGAVWHSHRIDLLPYLNNLTPGSEFQIAFDANATGGSRFFIDNIALRAVKLPAILKERGYGIYPVPIENGFTIWHLRQPADLRSVAVFNTIGQLVWRQQYNGNAPQTIRINSGVWPGGQYVVQMIYNDRQVTEKIMK